jgi:hypothetical protein
MWNLYEITVEHFASKFNPYSITELLKCFKTNTSFTSFVSFTSSWEWKFTFWKNWLISDRNILNIGVILKLYLSDQKVFQDSVKYFCLKSFEFHIELRLFIGWCFWWDIQFASVLQTPEIESIRFEVNNPFLKIPLRLNQLSCHKWTWLDFSESKRFYDSNLHSKCDCESPTVTVILTTKGFIFGDLTPIAWDSSGSSKADNSEQGFVFSVKDFGKSDPRCFPVVRSSPAIYCHSWYGEPFRDHTIYVADGCNENTTSSTHLGQSYRNSTRLTHTQLFTGERHFQVKELEVSSITR